jgi:3-hydroxyisobutyrate dehydrogenase-like beta-hydroxyacid dehydrogenase
MEPIVSTTPAICLLGFGEVGQLLGRQLTERGLQNLAAWDLKFDEKGSGPSRAVPGSGVRRARHARDAIAAAEIVISAVTAAQDVAAARSVAGHLQRNAWFLDLNSVSPGTKIEVSRIVGEHGGRYVEAAIMSPIAPRGLASPILLGGPHAQSFLPIAHELGFSGAAAFATELGRASAAKMCRSVLVKGLEALLAESLVTARHFGVADTVLDSVRNLLPAEDWPALARYMISRSLLHGARRAEEMREAARTVAEAGVTSSMSSGCVERQLWAAGRGDIASVTELAPMLDRLLASTRNPESER